MKKIAFAIVIVACFAFAAESFACTDFQIKAKDKSVVIGRSMEFGMSLKGSEVVVHPRGRKMTSMTLKGKKGVSWTSKYAFLGIDCFEEKDAVVDGINEKGLSVEFLWFPISEYQEVVPGKFVSIADLGSWVLGNFATVDEVKAALPKVNVVGEYVPQFKSVIGLHMAVHDAKGKNIVVEFIDGKQMIHDNPIGVMTNMPDFEWQINNLRNYVNLGPVNVDKEELAGVTLKKFGHGSGWLGIPGDWTPPSRFVRTARFVHASLTPKNAKEAVNLAEHILNTVDIPNGVLRDKVNMLVTAYDYTQWIVIKDLTNKVLYYRTYDNLALRKVDMKKLDLSAGAEMKSISMFDPGEIKDVTDGLL